MNTTRQPGDNECWCNSHRRQKFNSQQLKTSLQMWDPPTALEERLCFYPQENENFFHVFEGENEGQWLVFDSLVEQGSVTAADNCMLLGPLSLYFCFKLFPKVPGVPLGDFRGSAGENKCLMWDSKDSKSHLQSGIFPLRIFLIRDVYKTDTMPWLSFSLFF